MTFLHEAPVIELTEPQYTISFTLSELSEAIHEGSGKHHSKTPLRVICTNPQWDGHRILAERILQYLASETYFDNTQDDLS